MKEKKQNDKNKNGLIFTANTHPNPNFIVDDGVLKMIKANETLKVYMVIIRHTIGFNQDSIQMANSTIAAKTGLQNRNVIRTLQKLKKKYKLIDFESCKGGRAIKNIRILLPERFYSKEVGNEEDTIKELESKGYTVIPPAKKNDKPLQTEKPSSKNNSIIAEWNNFILWGKSNLTASSFEKVHNLKVEADEHSLYLEGNLTNLQKATIENYFKEKVSKKIKIIFIEGDK